jgi:tetratricopeptide (TPR) repeat protein
MVHLFDLLERASGLFVQERYARAIPLLEEILEADPYNLDAVLRLATSHSTLGRQQEAMAAFRRAMAMAPQSADVRLYLALHYARTRDWPRAVPVLEQIVVESPERVPALEALAVARERQGRVAEAIALREHIYRLREPAASELVMLGQQAMSIQQTPTAIEAFERARTLQGNAFAHDLELGVLYLSVRKLEEARSALDRIPSTHADYAMVLFKRAQVSVLLKEPDAPARIESARRHADSTTRALIAREQLFSNVRR